MLWESYSSKLLTFMILQDLLQITDIYDFTRSFTNKNIPQDLISIHQKIDEQSPDGARQIQKIVELFLLCFTFNNEARHRKFRLFLKFT